MNNDAEYRSGRKEDKPLFKERDPEDLLGRYDKRKLIIGLQKHFLVILSCILVFGFLGATTSYKFLSKYKAEAVVLYQEDERQRDLKGVFTLTNLSLDTVMESITLPKNIEAVKSILGLDLSVPQITGMIQIPRPSRKSSFVKIICSGDNPNLVVDIANTLAKVAVKKSENFTKKQLKLALDNFTREIDVIGNDLSHRMQNIEKFKQQNHFFEMKADNPIILNQVTQARDQFQKADLEYKGLLVEYQNLKRKTEALPDEVAVELSEVKDHPLQPRITSLETSLAEARARYAAENPKIKILETELTDLLGRVEANAAILGGYQRHEKNPMKRELELELLRLQGKVRSAQKVKQDIAVTASALEKKLQKLPAQQVALAQLLQTKDIIEEKLKFVNDAAEMAQLMINLPKGNVELFQLVDHADPYKDKWWVPLLPIFGMIFGFGVGISIALFLEMTDSKIRTSKEIDLGYNIPCILEIPEMRLLSFQNSEKKLRYFLRKLATHLHEIASRKIDPLTISFTSSTYGEGKTTIAYHLARYFTQVEKKVLFISLDYHENPYYDELAPKGIEDYLKGEASLQEILIPGEPSIIALHHQDQGMKELLQSSKAKELWKHLKSEYDVIIIDGPGMIQEDYAPELSAFADISLFVISGSFVKRSVVEQNLLELDAFGTRPTGLILNQIPTIYVNDETYKLRNKRSIWRNFWSFSPKKGCKRK